MSNRLFNGYALRALRRASGNSVGDCARGCMITVPSWEYLESGIVMASEAQIDRVCDLFDTDRSTFTVLQADFDVPAGDPIPVEVQHSNFLVTQITGDILTAASRIGLHITQTRAQQLATLVADDLLLDLR